MKKEVKIKINVNNGRKEVIETERPFTNIELEEKLFELGEILKAIINRSVGGMTMRDYNQLFPRIEQWREDLKE